MFLFCTSWTKLFILPSSFGSEWKGCYPKRKCHRNQSLSTDRNSHMYREKKWQKELMDLYRFPDFSMFYSIQLGGLNIWTSAPDAPTAAIRPWDRPPPPLAWAIQARKSFSSSVCLVRILNIRKQQLLIQKTRCFAPNFWHRCIYFSRRSHRPLKWPWPWHYMAAYIIILWTGGLF